jgi:hypothetical protein
MAEGTRCKQVEVVLTEIDAVRHAMSRANPGELVVLCVDKHPSVMAEPGDVVGLMCHADRQGVYDWIAGRGGTADSPETLGEKVRAARA